MNDEAVMNRDTHIDNNDTENNDQKVTFDVHKKSRVMSIRPIGGLFNIR